MNQDLKNFLIGVVAGMFTIIIMWTACLLCYGFLKL